MRGSGHASEIHRSARPGWRVRTAGIVACFFLVAGHGGVLAFQDTTAPAANTPVADQPAQQQPAQQQPATATETAAAAADFAEGAPHLEAIAQGLVTIDGPVVWRVREYALTATPQQETNSPSFTLQRSGASIIRNDLSTRRARLEPGEALFTPGGDPFTKVATGPDPSVIWVLELLPQTAAATPGPGSALFTSDPISNYTAGTYDFELQRAVLLPGEVSEIPEHTGPALVMITSGRVQVSSVGSPPTPAGAGSGILAPNALTLRNGDTQPASFVVLMLGDSVDGAEGATTGQPVNAAPTQAPLLQTPAPVTGVTPSPVVVLPTLAPEVEPTATAAPPVEQQQEVAPSPTPATQAAPGDGDTDGDGLSDADEATYGSDPLNKDYDADGLLDGEEVYTYGTDPLNNDTDGDGLLDGDEVHQYGTNPTTTDSDGDGLTDPDEIFTYGTNPVVMDTDGDGSPDGEEVLIHGTDPLDPNSHP